MEGPVLDPTLGMCDVMRRSMWAWCSGIKGEVSCRVAVGDAIRGHWGQSSWAIEGEGDWAVVVDKHGLTNAGAVSSTLLSRDKSAVWWARTRTADQQLRLEPVNCEDVLAAQAFQLPFAEGL